MKLTTCAGLVLLFIMLKAHAAQQSNPCTQGFAAHVTYLRGTCYLQTRQLRVGTGLRAADEIACAQNASAQIKFCRSGEQKQISAGVSYTVPNTTVPDDVPLKPATRTAVSEPPPMTPAPIAVQPGPLQPLPSFRGSDSAAPHENEIQRLAEAPRRAIQEQASSAFAQQGSIPRMKLTDNELSCQQLYAEVKQMKKIAADAKSRHESSQGTSAAATVLPFLPFLGILSGAVSVTAANEQVNAAERMQQAAARQDHLTQLFIMKKCKISDLDAKPVESSTPAPPP